MVRSCFRRKADVIKNGACEFIPVVWFAKFTALFCQDIMHYSDMFQ